MKSLSSRLTLWYALVVTVTVSLLLFLGRFYLEHNLISSIDLLNEVEFEEIRARIDNEVTEESQQALIDAIRDHAELDAALYFFQVGKTHEVVLYKSSNLGPYYLPKAVHGHPQVTVMDDELGLIRSMEINYAGLDIHVVSSLHSAEALFDDYERISFYVVSAVFLMSLAVGYLLSRLAIQPIAAIQASAQRVTASSFSERIPVPNTGDEIERMAILLNAMLDRLERSYQQVKRFTAEASHEFRTPLSIIRLQTERLLSNGDLPLQERESALQEQMEEVERLNKMVDGMLFLAKADAGVLPLVPENVSMVDFLADFESDAVLLADELGAHFRLLHEGPSYWYFDPNWMRQVLRNLFANALHASEPGQTICLECALQDGMLCLRVKDEGPGVPEDKLRMMFNRFERLDSSGKTKGNGLGLAICQSIVQRHGGRIRAVNRQDGHGLILEVLLPKNSAE